MWAVSSHAGTFSSASVRPVPVAVAPTAALADSIAPRTRFCLSLDADEAGEYGERPCEQ